MSPDLIYTITAYAIPIIIAITFHEAAHGFVAWKLGDDTAKRLGRVTFNPIKHVDLMGTIIVPALFVYATGFAFGWAKPVPVNFRRLHNPKRDMVWVAAAGPGINIALAVLSQVLIGVLGATSGWLYLSLEISKYINILLAVFNMIPLPPLDGGRVAVGLLPENLAIRLARLERVGLLIIIMVLLVLPFLGAELGVNLSIFDWLIRPVVFFMIDVIEFVFGGSLIR